MEIDKSKPVLVTGANGYVASWLVKKLLEEERTVHAAVRNPDQKEKISHLNALSAKHKGQIRYFKADLLSDGSYAEAMEGCELVFHTASPFALTVKDPQKDLIDPAVEGTSNVLHQANKTASVKRVVLTSSCAAIYTDAADAQQAPGGLFTEDIWNKTASFSYQPYSYSKTLAEQKAWEIAGAQQHWDLVVINPSFVMGPFLNPEATSSESFNFLKQMGDGTLKKGVPKIGIGVVDVRDVAEAHFRAGFTPSAKGRHITSAHNSDFLEMSRILHDEFGKEFPIPNKPVPKWLLMFVGPMINKALTRKYIRNNVNHVWKADNSKIRKELGMEFRPLEVTLKDAFQVLIDTGVVKRK